LGQVASNSIREILQRDPMALAPMAGVSDPPFRKLVREMGCAFAYTEMISDNALIYGNERTSRMLTIPDGDHPLSVQLFGSDPARVAEAARLVEDAGADFIDINMGCPTPKITSNGEGAALMLYPTTAREMVRAVRRAVSLPITVKTRKGWDKGRGSAVEIAKIAEDEGASAVAVHGRYREQFYTGKADWSVIGEVKAAVGIPVLGSGDVFSPEDALAMLQQTSCDGVLVARGALGNPWIFGRFRRLWEAGETSDEPLPGERIRVALRHLRMQVDYAGEHLGVLQMRKHIGWYIKGLRNATRVRTALNTLNTQDDVEQLLMSYLSELD
jgi:tRNA-dihydrouridine synthase B